MGETRQLTILGRYLYQSIPTITRFIADAAAAAGLSDDEIFHCEMAADEACTNIFEHAYNEQPDDNIEITCYIESGECTIEIIDHGKPFDPDSIPTPVVSENIENIEPGGIGLHLMRRLMDEVAFDFTETGNRLRMVKRHSKSDSSSSQEFITIEESNEDFQIVVIQGRLDAAHTPQTEDAIDSLIATKHLRIIVDMSGVEYISSRGLKALISAWRQISNAGGNFILCGLQSRVMSVFETVGFTEVFDIYPTRDEALLSMQH